MAMSPTDPLSYTQRLIKVRAAIDAVISGTQSGSYEGRSWTLANLAELRKIETEYSALAEQERVPSPGRNRISYFTPIT
jgi:hypothetical protein